MLIVEQVVDIEVRAHGLSNAKPWVHLTGRDPHPDSSTNPLPENASLSTSAIRAYIFRAIETHKVEDAYKEPSSTTC